MKELNYSVVKRNRAIRIADAIHDSISFEATARDGTRELQEINDVLDMLDLPNVKWKPDDGRVNSSFVINL